MGDFQSPENQPQAVPDSETVLHLHAEEAAVSKEQIVTGRVRVSTVTREREAVVDEPLAHQRVEIHREPVGKQIASVPDVRTEGDVTIVPVVEEVLVVERRLLLKEEVHVRRVRETERFQDHVTLRSQEAVIDREQPSGDTDSSV